MLKVKEMRENFGLTQKELGQKLGIPGHNIGDWERKKCEPSIEMLIKLANVFDCSVDYLIGNTDDFDIKINNFTNNDEQYILTEYRKLLPMYKKLIKQQIEVFNGSGIHTKTY